MFEKYRRIRRIQKLKFLHESTFFHEPTFEVEVVDSLYDLVYCLINTIGVRRFIRLLDEEAYYSLWACLLDFKKEYPLYFNNCSEEDD